MTSLELGLVLVSASVVVGFGVILTWIWHGW